MRSLFAAPLLLCRAFLAAYGDCGEDGGSDGQEQEQDGSHGGQRDGTVGDR